MQVSGRKYIFVLLISFTWCCERTSMNPEIIVCDPATFIDTSRVYYKYYQNEKDTLDFIPFVLHARLDSSLTEDEVDNLLFEYELTVANQLLPFRHNSFLLFAPKGKRPEEFFTFYGQTDVCGFGNLDVVQYATPLFWAFPEIPGDSSVCMLTDEFLVRIDTTITSLQRLSDINAENNVVLVKLVSGSRQTYLLKVTKRSTLNALDMGNFYQESGVVLWGEPNFTCLIQF